MHACLFSLDDKTVPSVHLSLGVFVPKHNNMSRVDTLFGHSLFGGEALQYPQRWQQHGRASKPNLFEEVLN